MKKLLLLTIILVTLLMSLVSATCNSLSGTSDDYRVISYTNIKKETSVGSPLIFDEYKDINIQGAFREGQTYDKRGYAENRNSNFYLNVEDVPFAVYGGSVVNSAYNTGYPSAYEVEVYSSDEGFYAIGLASRYWNVNAGPSDPTFVRGGSDIVGNSLISTYNEVSKYGTYLIHDNELDTTTLKIVAVDCANSNSPSVYQSTISDAHDNSVWNKLEYQIDYENTEVHYYKNDMLIHTFNYQSLTNNEHFTNNDALLKGIPYANADGCYDNDRARYNFAPLSEVFYGDNTNVEFRNSYSTVRLFSKDRYAHDGETRAIICGDTAIDARIEILETTENTEFFVNNFLSESYLQSYDMDIITEFKNLEKVENIEGYAETTSWHRSIINFFRDLIHKK